MTKGSVLIFTRNDLKLENKDKHIRDIDIHDFVIPSFRETYKAECMLFFDGERFIKLLKSRQSSTGVFEKNEYV